MLFLVLRALSLPEENSVPLLWSSKNDRRTIRQTNLKTTFELPELSLHKYDDTWRSNLINLAAHRCHRTDRLVSAGSTCREKAVAFGHERRLGPASRKESRFEKKPGIRRESHNETHQVKLGGEGLISKVLFPARATVKSRQRNRRFVVPERQKPPNTGF